MQISSAACALCATGRAAWPWGPGGTEPTEYRGLLHNRRRGPGALPAAGMGAPSWGLCLLCCAARRSAAAGAPTARSPAAPGCHREDPKR